MQIDNKNLVVNQAIIDVEHKEKFEVACIPAFSITCLFLVWQDNQWNILIIVFKKEFIKNQMYLFVCSFFFDIGFWNGNLP